ncbi:TRAP transporter permease [Aristaeella lactis]|uniref:TRAP transporter, 4TM/12TM fusion protein n=1 Tax=Aristaeella lactis TaxID=3046383 RepID=A0AC61PI67_9FIRM|nr:TRAP transporter, 4TM/12TM fusion protein [Aristaeella lactis]
MDNKDMNMMPESAEAEKQAAAADLDAIMRKYDRESNVRIWVGKPKIFVGIILAVFSLYCMYVTLFANFLDQVRLSSFLGLVIIMGYLTYPAKKGHVKVNHMPWYDIVLMILGAAAFFYYTFRAPALMTTRIKTKLTDPVYITAGIVGIVVLCELCRRSVGLPILCVAGLFLSYTIYFYVKDGKLLSNVVHELFYNENGLLSTPLNVCSKYIVVFIIFGAFLEKTGISEFFIALANGLTGRFAGGPAKVAVISSALCGMVSGSSVGNTVTTGSITIPMMKKTGYDKNFSGAVEAAASTGGQIMPPIMGAAAFLMADYLGVPYSDIIVRAILPACLYFLGVFLSVHLEAKRLGLKGLSREQLPRIRELMKESYLLLPLAILIYLVCSNTKTMQFSAAVSILATIAVGVISNIHRNIRHGKPLQTGEGTHNQRFRPVNVFEALENGGRSCISVAVACGVAGLICGCLTVTGLASTVINAIVTVSQGKLFLGLLLTMICCIILGMGLPTTATYCIMASTCAPILFKMDVPLLAAHFFVFYYGIVADITPPVALAAYAGSAISGGSPMKTGVNATRLAIAGFIIPFIFALSPDMLLINATWQDVLLITVTSIIGMYGVTFGLSGFHSFEMSGQGRVVGYVQRIISIAGGLLLIYPGILTDIIGVALVGAVLIWRRISSSGKNKIKT